MEVYDYRDAVKNDIKDYIENNYEKEDLLKEDKEELYEKLYDEMWTADSITGNGSGSYTFSTWQAEENICHNLELAQEAYENFGFDGIKYDDGAEAVDVTIRCYLLGEYLTEVLDELFKEAE